MTVAATSREGIGQAEDQAADGHKHGSQAESVPATEAVGHRAEDEAKKGSGDQGGSKDQADGRPGVAEGLQVKAENDRKGTVGEHPDGPARQKEPDIDAGAGDKWPGKPM